MEEKIGFLSLILGFLSSILGFLFAILGRLFSTLGFAPSTLPEKFWYFGQNNYPCNPDPGIEVIQDLGNPREGLFRIMEKTGHHNKLLCSTGSHHERSFLANNFAFHKGRLQNRFAVI